MIVFERVDVSVLSNHKRFAKFDVSSVDFANAVQGTLIAILRINKFQNEVPWLIRISKHFRPQTMLFVRSQLFETAIDRLKVNQADRVIGSKMISARFEHQQEFTIERAKIAKNWTTFDDGNLPKLEDYIG